MQLLENLYRNATEHGGKHATVTVGGLETGFYMRTTVEEFQKKRKERSSKPITQLPRAEQVSA